MNSRYRLCVTLGTYIFKVYESIADTARINVWYPNSSDWYTDLQLFAKSRNDSVEMWNHMSILQLPHQYVDT